VVVRRRRRARAILMKELERSRRVIPRRIWFISGLCDEELSVLSFSVVSEREQKIRKLETELEF